VKKALYYSIEDNREEPDIVAP